MYLKRLNILNFKNISSISLELSPKINCFVGSNGAGKTNILDAIHYLSLCKSLNILTDNQCVKHEENFFMIEGEYNIDNENIENISCSYTKPKGKVVKRGAKEYSRLSEHIGLFPLVLISPSDTYLISEGSEERRRFLNSFISQIDRSYLSSLVRYNSLIAERNKLLKEGFSSNELIDILDMQIAYYGEPLYKARVEYINLLAPLTTKYYAEISNDKESVSMSYNSKINSDNFTELLAESRMKDSIIGHTTVGIHRDNIEFKIGDYPIRRYGSQGQQKSFLIALKLAQFDIIASAKERQPMLLLDDIFDKLDIERVERLISIVLEKQFGQIFITDANKVRIDKILEGLPAESNVYSVDNGEVVNI